jgi:hypothetical protein
MRGILQAGFVRFEIVQKAYRQRNFPQRPIRPACRWETLTFSQLPVAVGFQFAASITVNSPSAFIAAA